MRYTKKKHILKIWIMAFAMFVFGLGGYALDAKAEGEATPSDAATFAQDTDEPVYLPTGLERSEKTIDPALAEKLEKASKQSGSLLRGSNRAVASFDWSSYSATYCYSVMNEDEKALYDQLMNDSIALINNTATKTVTTLTLDGELTAFYDLYDIGNLSFEQAKNVVYCFGWQNPQFYFYKYGYVNTTDEKRITLQLYPEFASASDRATATLTVKNRIQAMQTVLDASLSGKSYLEKEKTIVDYVTDTLYYQLGVPYNQSLYSALTKYEGEYKTVCAGYSKLFNLLANHYGLETISVVSEDHAWNKIKIGSTWYNVDPTWVDTLGGYYWYNKSDRTFHENSSHIENDFLAYQPACPVDYSDGTCPTCGTRLDCVVTPKCEEEGTIRRFCPENEEHYSLTEPYAATGHQWDGGRVTTPASCTAAGVRTFYCRQCTATMTEDITPLGHLSDGGKVTTAAKCTTAGVKTYTCTREGCGVVIKTETISPTGHSWDAGTVTKAATEKETGVMTYKCTNKGCTATKAETIPKVTVPAASVSYITHIQNIGWESAYRADGAVSGTSGRSLRLEGIRIKVAGNSNLGVQYTTHCQDYGWLAWSANGEMNGTEGESKRLEAIMINLTGADKDLYDIYYRVHAQNIGWMNWAKNGAPAGTAGYGYRLEAIQIQVVQRGASYDAAKGGIKSVSSDAYRDKNHGGTPVVLNSSIPNLSYRTHVQNVGWQAWRTNGAFSGTSGRSLRLEGINIKLTNKDYTGGIRYKTHIQNIGWENQWRTDGTMSGTSGRSLRLEAIDVELYGEIASYYDIYYRVHAQDVGWMGWAKNGAHAGTAGYGRRLEGIQIVLVKKGAAAPAATVNGITSVTAKPYLSR